MPATIGYGVVGTGMTGCEHLRNIALTPDAEVLALCNPMPPSLGGRAMRYYRVVAVGG